MGFVIFSEKRVSALVLGFRSAAQLHSWSRRYVRYLTLLASATLVAGILPLSAQAQTFPSKPIRIISQYPVGALVDTLTRQVGQEMSKNWGVPVIVDSRPGANNIISMQACANAPPDGYTICHMGRSTQMLTALGVKLPFDLDRDFDPVTNMMYTVLALVAHPSVGANNLKELLDAARAKPGVFNYASLGSGSMPNLLLEWIKKTYNVSITHVPYKGPPPVLQAMLSGESHVTYVGVANFAAFHQAGKMRILGVSGDKRSPLVPDIPTLVEQGLTGLDNTVWFGLLAPAGTPKEARERIYREVARIFAIPAFREKFLVAQAFDPINSSPDDFGKFLKTDRESGAELVRISGARFE
ncbi:MAG: Bug family tripartite tricarboxylate transporter substrate binding protein [Burkholderiales bacterium]